MAKIVVVTSGKGGVGKTTTSASFATGLALKGFKTVVIDFDVGLRNLDLVMGCERRVVYDFINVIHNEANLHQALIKDKQCENLYVLAASQTRDKDALTQEGVGRVLTELAIGKLFIAGIIPGLIVVLLCIGYILWVAKTQPQRVGEGVDDVLGLGRAGQVAGRLVQDEGDFFLERQRLAHHILAGTVRGAQNEFAQPRNGKKHPPVRRLGHHQRMV